jgi:hypothetical protein
MKHHGSNKGSAAIAYRILSLVLLFISACTGTGSDSIPDAFVVVGINKELRFFLAEKVQPPGSSSQDPQFKVDQGNTVLDLVGRRIVDNNALSSDLWVLLPDRIRRYPTTKLSDTSTALPVAANLDLTFGLTCEEASYLRQGPSRMLIVCAQKNPSAPRLFSLALSGGSLETIDISSLGTATARNARYALGNGDGLLMIQNRLSSPEFTLWPSRTGPGDNAISSRPIAPDISSATLRDLVFENTASNSSQAVAVIGSGNNTVLASWNLQSGTAPGRGEKAAVFNRVLVDTRTLPVSRVLFGSALAQANGGVQQIAEYTSIGTLSLGAGVMGLDGFFYATSNSADNNFLLTLDLQVPLANLRSTDFRKVNLDGKGSGVAYLQVIPGQ